MNNYLALQIFWKIKNQREILNMHRNNDINQVSMSSIEPAATNPNTQDSSHHQEHKMDSASSQKVSKAKLKINNMSSEKDDSYGGPVSEQDLDAKEVQVNDIPEFTIGPGALNAPGGSQKSSPSKDDDQSAPFKQLPRALKIEQIDSKKAPQVLKQNQIKLKTTQNQNSSKRNLLKKNVFESDMGLSTGRFESENIQQTLSKSANQAQALNAINQEFEQEANNLENEMRETSYFKQQTDDEQKPKSSVVTTTALDSQNIQNLNITNLKSRDEGSVGDENGSAMSKNRQITNKEGIQLFKISSRSQMKHRAQRNNRKNPDNILTAQLSGSNNGSHNAIDQDSLSPISPSHNRGLGAMPSIGGNSSIAGSIILETPTTGNGQSRIQKTYQRQLDLDNDNFMRSNSMNPKPEGGNPNFSAGRQGELQIDDDDEPEDNGPPSTSNKNKSRKIKVQEKELNEIQRVNQQNEKHATANFGVLNVQKQHMSQVNKNNYSALKGSDEILGPESEEQNADVQNKMFTSMSDIGFPANIHNYNLKVNKNQKGASKREELITKDQIQRMMDTQNNWRVRTKTIDEMLHDVQERVENDSEYMMDNSERFLDFFVQLLTDQNFKIVLNTLNILNMLIWMPLQRQRYEKLMKQELTQDQSWGLSNAILGRHIPLIVKKLADSKNIIRQEAIRCLFGINEIMRSGSKKDNNFIALILPYLNNSSNWHIREELLHLLIKCFLSSKDTHEFDSYQILDSIIQLFGDTKEKIRNLALEAIAAFASIGDRNKMIEIMFQLNVDKDFRELVQSRLEYGMFPVLNQDGNVEIPYHAYIEHNNNYDVDSVAHSVTNQTQISQGNKNSYQSNQEYSTRRKQSIGVSSQKASNQVNQMRGNSSGRKIVVATANATNQQLGVSHQDEIMQQAFLQSKRTASANNPGQLEFEGHLPIGQNMITDPANSFSYSVGGNTGIKGSREQRLLDELSIPYDLNGSSFLPKLHNVMQFNDSKNLQYSSQQYQRDRVIGSSGGPSMGYIGSNLDPNFQMAGNVPISGGNKRSNKYLHGTPGHPNSYQAHFSQSGNGTNLQNQFNRGNSGKILGNHPINNSISNKSPSLYDQNTTLFDMSGNVGSLFGGDNNFQNRSGPGQHIKHLSNLGANGMPPGYEMEADFLSVAGAHSNHHQTPSSFNQDQILYSAGGYRQHIDHGDIDNSSFNFGMQGMTNISRDSKLKNNMMVPSTANSHDVSNPGASPNNRGNINFMDGQNQQQQQRRQQAQAVKNQNTFYSDGTTTTGITATTGATSQNRGHPKNQIIQMKGAGPPQHTFQLAPGEENQVAYHQRGPGPIKAVRNFGPDSSVEQDLLIDNRKQKANLKIKTKEPSVRQSIDGGNEDEANRSFSYNKEARYGSKANLNVKEVLSAGIKRGQFGTGEKLAGGEDPALLTQSSKIVYLQTEDLEPLSKPEKEFKKAMQGVNGDDWSEQFEACNIIRRVCKHHQSLILQTGNQLQGLVSVLIKLADSLRSAVSRNALITLNDMFLSLKRVMEPLLDPIIKILLKKGTDTNQFIAQEADKCLVSLVSNCQESKVLQILQLQNPNNRSTVYRLKMCYCLQNIVKSLGNNLLFFRENDKLLVLLANYLQDANQEVRQQAKIAFVSMSQAIMGQNELEKLLQRVLNEVQYRKVKEFLDKEPTHLMANQGSHIDFVITNANNQNVAKQKVPNKQHQQSFKSFRQHNGLAQKHVQAENQDQVLNIQAKSILNPQLAKEGSSGFLSKIAQQQNSQKSDNHQTTTKFGEDGPHDQFFIDSIKELILKSQVNEWRLRHESSEQLFELIRANIHKFTKSLKMVELADAICKLLNDSNAKIQISALENFNKIFQSIEQFVETYIQMFYKSIISNLGSSNVGVRKNSEQILKRINDSIQEKNVLLQPLANMIQYNSNARLKPALIEQLIDILDHISELSPQNQKILLPVSFKLLDDNKNEVKSRTEKLIKKLYNIMGQQVLEACPQVKLQRVCDICLSQSKNMSMAGTNSSGKGSQGGFGANGNQLHLNSRT